jgi:hypothetical protein
LIFINSSLGFRCLVRTFGRYEISSTYVKNPYSLSFEEGILEPNRIQGEIFLESSQTGIQNIKGCVEYQYLSMVGPNYQQVETQSIFIKSFINQIVAFVF